MDIQTILFSFKGRIGRGTYWLSIVPVIVAVHFFTFAPIHSDARIGPCCSIGSDSESASCPLPLLEADILPCPNDVGFGP